MQRPCRSKATTCVIHLLLSKIQYSVCNAPGACLSFWLVFMCILRLKDTKTLKFEETYHVLDIRVNVYSISYLFCPGCGHILIQVCL